MTENRVQIGRAPGGERFVLLLSETVRDKRLSYRDVGVLAMLSDLPAELPTAHKMRMLLDAEGRESRDAILNSVQKLLELGYLVSNDDLSPAHG